jgi:hypothetical protein
MLPTIAPANQELLLALCQKQMQNNFSPQQQQQQNPLAQLMQMKLQLDLLKLMSQDSKNIPNLGTEQTQLIALSSYSSNTNGKGSQLGSNSELSNILLLNKTTQRGQLVNDLDSNKKGFLSLKENSLSDLMVGGVTIPAFKDSQEQQQQQHNSLFDSPEQDGDSLSSRSKKIKKINTCGHPERGHYAKNMCNQCYHKFGRNKKPWKCSHDKLYAHGLCQNCYINEYNKKRSVNPKDKKDVSSTNSGYNELDTDVPASVNSNEEPLTLEDKAAFADL